MIDVSKIKRKPWLQKLIDENGPVTTYEDMVNGTEKYWDSIKMTQADFIKKYSKKN